MYLRKSWKRDWIAKVIFLILEIKFDYDIDDKAFIQLVTGIIKSKKIYIVNKLFGFMCKSRDTLIYAVFTKEFQSLFSLEKAIQHTNDGISTPI